MTPIATTTLTVRRLIPATPAEVFDVWLDPTSPGGPWFSHSFILDAKVDGLFYLAMGHAGRQWPHYGRFLTIERPTTIAHTWVSEATRGLESVVTLTFVPRGDDTELTLVHSGVPDDDFGRQHSVGWDFILGMIAERFAGRRG